MSEISPSDGTGAVSEEPVAALNLTATRQVSLMANNVPVPNDPPSARPSANTSDSSPPSESSRSPTDPASAAAHPQDNDVPMVSTLSPTSQTPRPPTDATPDATAVEVENSASSNADSASAASSSSSEPPDCQRQPPEEAIVQSENPEAPVAVSESTPIEATDDTYVAEEEGYEDDSIAIKSPKADAAADSSASAIENNEETVPNSPDAQSDALPSPSSSSPSSSEPSIGEVATSLNLPADIDEVTLSAPPPVVTARAHFPPLAPDLYALDRVYCEDPTSQGGAGLGSGKSEIGTQTVLSGRHLLLGPLGIAAAVAETEFEISDEFSQLISSPNASSSELVEIRDFLALYRPALRVVYATYARSSHPLPAITAQTFPSFVSGGAVGTQFGPKSISASSFSAEQRRAERLWWSAHSGGQDTDVLFPTSSSSSFSSTSTSTTESSSAPASASTADSDPTHAASDSSSGAVAVAPEGDGATTSIDSPPSSSHDQASDSEIAAFSSSSGSTSTSSSTSTSTEPICKCLHACMNAREFLFLCTELGLFNHRSVLAQKREAIEHFRATCADERHPGLSFPGFVECLLRIAMARFSSKNLTPSQIMLQPAMSARSKVSSLFVALGLNDIEVLYQKLSNAFSSSEPESIDVSSASDWQKPPAVPTSSVSDPSKSTDVAEFDFQMTPDALDSEIEKFLRESSAASAPEKKSAKSGGVKALRKLSRSDSRESNLSASPRTPSGATSTHDGKTSNKSDPSESETARGKRHSFEHEVQSSLQIITQHAQAFNSKGNVRASSTTPHAAKMNDAHKTATIDAFRAALGSPMNQSFSPMGTSSSIPTMHMQQQQNQSPNNQVMSQYAVNAYSGGFNQSMPSRKLLEASSYATMYGLDQPMYMSAQSQAAQRPPPPLPVPNSQFYPPIVGSALHGYIASPVNNSSDSQSSQTTARKPEPEPTPAPVAAGKGAPAAAISPQKGGNTNKPGAKGVGNSPPPVPANAKNSKNDAADKKRPGGADENYLPPAASKSTAVAPAGSDKKNPIPASNGAAKAPVPPLGSPVGKQSSVRLAAATAAAHQLLSPSGANGGGQSVSNSVAPSARHASQLHSDMAAATAAVTGKHHVSPAAPNKGAGGPSKGAAAHANGHDDLKSPAPHQKRSSNFSHVGASMMGQVQANSQSTTKGDSMSKANRQSIDSKVQNLKQKSNQDQGVLPMQSPAYESIYPNAEPYGEDYPDPYYQQQGGGRGAVGGGLMSNMMMSSPLPSPPHHQLSQQSGGGYYNNSGYGMPQHSPPQDPYMYGGAQMMQISQQQQQLQPQQSYGGGAVGGYDPSPFDLGGGGYNHHGSMGGLGSAPNSGYKVNSSGYNGGNPYDSAAYSNTPQGYNAMMSMQQQPQPQHYQPSPMMNGMNQMQYDYNNGGYKY